MQPSGRSRGWSTSAGRARRSGSTRPRSRRWPRRCPSSSSKPLARTERRSPALQRGGGHPALRRSAASGTTPGSQWSSRISTTGLGCARSSTSRFRWSRSTRPPSCGHRSGRGPRVGGGRTAHRGRALQRAGLAAGVVQSSEDLWRDPQLWARQFVEPHAHPDLGTHYYGASPYRLNRTPGRVGMVAGRLGADTTEFLQEWLGLGTDEVQKLIQAGAAFQA